MKSSSKTYFITACAIITAIICFAAPIAVPIGPIPISLTNLVLYFAIFILGTKGTMASYVVYLLLGIAGLPVFSGYQGGLAKVAGPTGGYLLGFFPMIVIGGLVFEKTSGKMRIPMTIAALILGTAVAYIFGTMWFVLQMKCDVPYALGMCVLPFIPFDIGKIIAAAILGTAVRKPLLKQNLI